MFAYYNTSALKKEGCVGVMKRTNEFIRIFKMFLQLFDFHLMHDSIKENSKELQLTNEVRIYDSSNNLVGKLYYDNGFKFYMIKDMSLIMGHGKFIDNEMQINYNMRYDKNKNLRGEFTHKKGDIIPNMITNEYRIYTNDICTGNGRFTTAKNKIKLKDMVEEKFISYNGKTEHSSPYAKVNIENYLSKLTYEKIDLTEEQNDVYGFYDIKGNYKEDGYYLMSEEYKKALLSVDEKYLEFLSGIKHNVNRFSDNLFENMARVSIDNKGVLENILFIDSESVKVSKKVK